MWVGKKNVNKPMFQVHMEIPSDTMSWAGIQRLYKLGLVYRLPLCASIELSYLKKRAMGHFQAIQRFVVNDLLHFDAKCIQVSA